MIKITNDVFDIASRLKSINSSYELYFDKTDSKFKVFAKGSLQLILPYSSLDCRAIDYTLKTQICNIKRLSAEIDKHNEQLKKSLCKKQQEKRESTIDRLASQIL